MTLRSTVEMQRHAHDLAAAFGVALLEESAMRPEMGMAVSALRVVLIAPIIDETTYAVALHELGHLIAPAGAVRTTSTVASLGLSVFEEEAAWAWARHYALEWTAVMESVAAWALQTYTTAQQEQTSKQTKQQIRPAYKPIDWNRWK